MYRRKLFDTLIDAESVVYRRKLFAESIVYRRKLFDTLIDAESVVYRRKLFDTLICLLCTEESYLIH